MIKSLLTLLFILILFTNAEAQKDSIVYYLTNSGHLVSKDSADYRMVIMPPNVKVNRRLNVVYEYYKNGAVRLKTGSYTEDLNLKYEGPYISYFSDGKTTSIGTYQGGELKDRQRVYYHNGKLYSVINYLRLGVPYYEECRDSTGVVLTENGKGLWKQFDDDFTYILAEGKIENGLQEDEWIFRKSPTESFKLNYIHGEEKKNMRLEADETWVPVEVVPSYPGGLEALSTFLYQNIRYPAVARENGTQGKVIISFVVTKEGNITDAKVSRGIGDGCDEEALRVINLMPKWLPGTAKGKPVAVAFSIPVNFGLTEK